MLTASPCYNAPETPGSKLFSPSAAEPDQGLSIARFSSQNSTSSFTRPSAFTLMKPSSPAMATSTRWRNWQSGRRSLPGARLGWIISTTIRRGTCNNKYSSKQLQLAQAAKLPIVIHCRPSDKTEDAWEDCLKLLQEHWAASGLGGILHCFTGTWAHATRALDMGFMISFAGNVTFPKALQIREAAKRVPLDRLLIETDSPFLAPVPHRGKRNEPSFVKEVARQMGELRGLSTEDIGLQTAKNFYRFFSLHEKLNSI